jgi:uncharacterized protein Yka (UPF0111/DUF47 family)
MNDTLQQLQREREEIFLDLVNTYDVLVDRYRALASNYTNTHGVDAKELTDYIAKYEEQITTQEEANADLLNRLLDRNVTIGQLEDQVTDLQHLLSVDDV